MLDDNFGSTFAQGASESEPTPNERETKRLLVEPPKREEMIEREARIRDLRDRLSKVIENVDALGESMLKAQVAGESYLTLLHEIRNDAYQVWRALR